MLKSAEPTGAEIRVPTISADIVRVVAISMVVMIHATMGIQGEGLSDGSWSFRLFRGYLRLGVPLFVMLSGYLWSRRQNRFHLATWAGRLWRVGLPYASWTVAYSLWNRHWHHLPISLSEMSSALLHGTAYYHLWFMPLLIKVYLLAPLIVWFVGRAKPGAMFAWVVLLFGGIYVPSTFLELARIPHVLGLFTLAGFAGYFAFGAALARPDVVMTKALRVVSLAVAVAAPFAAFVLTRAGYCGDAFALQYLSPVVAFSSAGLFAGLVGQPRLESRREGVWCRLTSLVSFTTFFVYAVHPILLELLSTLFGKPDSAWARDSLPMALLLGSIALVASAVIAGSVSLVPPLWTLLGAAKGSIAGVWRAGRGVNA